jgi:hypothetical protein
VSSSYQKADSHPLGRAHIEFMSNGFTPAEFAELLISSVLGGSLTGVLLIYAYQRYKRYKHQRDVESLRESNFIPIQEPPPDEILSSLSTPGSNSSIRSLDDGSHDRGILYPVPNFAPLPLPSTDVKLPIPITHYQPFSRVYSHSIRYPRSSGPVAG